MGQELPVGKDRPVVATTRANQSCFRNALLDNYQRRCCLTGLDIEPLLMASHIKPWSKADLATERLLPENGLLLNALHDRAFNQGLITIDRDLHIVVSHEVPRANVTKSPEFDYLWSFNGRRIRVSGPFRPHPDFIEYHNDVVLRG